MSVIGGDTPQLPLLVDGAPPLHKPLTRAFVEGDPAVRSPTFLVGVDAVLVTCAIFGTHIAPYDPINDSFAPGCAVLGARSASTVWAATSSVPRRRASSCWWPRGNDRRVRSVR
jgi:hypothetical protein